MSFEVSDMENMSFPDDTFNCIISNGAFCMTPNKRAAFE